MIAYICKIACAWGGVSTQKYDEVDSIKFEMEVRAEEFSIVLNKKQALLIAAVIENYFS